MKRIISIMIVMMFVFSASFASAAINNFVAEDAEFAGDEILKAEEEKSEGWTPIVEIAVTANNALLGGTSGMAFYKKSLSTQSLTVGMDKSGTGLYIQALNYSPSKQEGKETDFSLGFYTEVAGVKIDAGYGFWWIREKGTVDYHAIYIGIDFPAPFLGIVPFVKAEYDFAKKENGVDMNGFMYYGGLKHEFKPHEKVSIIAEVGAGGNTGVYGMQAENMSFSREKLELTISITDWLKLKGSIATQQNLGLQNGIADDTDKVFTSGAITIALP